MRLVEHTMTKLALNVFFFIFNIFFFVNWQVENQERVTNFDDILANSDAFMVSRGDLGIEIPIKKIFLA